MTDEELAAIAERAAVATEQATWMTDADFIAHARTDIPALLAEVEQWRVLGRQMANYEPEHFDSSGYFGCQFCLVERREEPPYDQSDEAWRAWLTHAPDCPVLKARALLEGK